MSVKGSSSTTGIKYEMMILVSGRVSKTEYEAQVQKTRDMLVSNGANIVLEHDMGLRDLAYEIKHNAQGYYFVFNFAIDGQKLAEINKLLLHEVNVLRHLVIKIPSDYNFKVVMESLEKRKIQGKDADMATA